AAVARSLRNLQTDAEKILWWHLRNRHIAGVKFRRQFPAGPYFLDFFCTDLRLAIEVDGGQHFSEEQLIRDEARTAYLGAHFVRVLRFTNLEVIKETESVL